MGQATAGKRRRRLFTVVESLLWKRLMEAEETAMLKFAEQTGSNRGKERNAAICDCT
jgi:hypothetical protein